MALRIERLIKTAKMSEPYNPRHLYNDHNYWLLCHIMSASRVVATFASISSRKSISTGAQTNFFGVILLDVGLFLLTAKERNPNFSAVCGLLPPEPFTNGTRDISERNTLFSNAVRLLTCGSLLECHGTEPRLVAETVRHQRHAS